METTAEEQVRKQKTQKYIQSVQKHISGYTLLDIVGHGGFGVIFKVTPEPGSKLYEGNSKVHALKIPRYPTDKSDKAVFREKVEEIQRLFLEELGTLQVLDHKNILDIQDYRKDHFPSYVTRKLTCTLADLGEGPKEPLLVAKVGVDTGGAVLYLTKRKIVHRDIKPGNLMLDLDQTPSAFLIDFGSKEYLSRPYERILRSTLEYIPPEVLEYSQVSEWMRKRSERPGCEGDVYSLGVTLRELLLGDKRREDNGEVEWERRGPYHYVFGKKSGSGSSSNLKDRINILRDLHKSGAPPFMERDFEELRDSPQADVVEGLLELTGRCLKPKSSRISIEELYAGLFKLYTDKRGDLAKRLRN